MRGTALKEAACGTQFIQQQNGEKKMKEKKVVATTSLKKEFEPC